ncbi:hypothetical protein A5772_21515 [Mycolicibacter sinensis]|uniref:Uncharacterized protein n=1 Tax=Mycolicibacter sinensis (strain JDM601) TaxID=875328 RepID=A0A1A2EP36_MYCSD|nr:hypothetical protein A5772_21515 [Mycolicibacter sinensis]OBG09368.1 hypothetical protein A5771_01550 [Mycolicibacter sinensis]
MVAVPVVSIRRHLVTALRATWAVVIAMRSRAAPAHVLATRAGAFGLVRYAVINLVILTTAIQTV